MARLPSVVAPEHVAARRGQLVPAGPVMQVGLLQGHEDGVVGEGPVGLGLSSVRKSGLPERSTPFSSISIQAPSCSTTTPGMQRSVT